MYHYPSPPPGWSAFDYAAPPPTSPHYAYYATQFANPYGSPRVSSKRHSRKASYAAPRETPWFTQGFYDAMPDYGSPPRKHDHVSASLGGHHSRRHTSGNPSSHKRPVFVDVADDAFYDAPRYAFREPPLDRSGRRQPPTPWRDSFSQHRRYPSMFHRKPEPAADHYFFCNQVPIYDDIDSGKRSRARRQSTSTRTPPKPKPTASSKSPRKATEDDAVRAGISPGYSIKNWDPTEAPIVLLGSVFDANSLGKWIYDWTVFHHGAATPMADVAGELWLLLIKLAGKLKRAKECLRRIQHPDAREIVRDFLESGERLTARFKKVLKACELYMWKAAKRESGRASVSMGRNAGCEFVESIFGRDRELESIEKLMNSIRLWSMRFDANCEDILRRPTAV